MVALARGLFLLLCACRSLAGAAPVVNVRLMPPASMPGMGEEVGNLEDARRSMESAGLHQLDIAFRDAIRNAESRVGGVVAKFAPELSHVAPPLSFVDASAGVTTDSSHFRLEVSPLRAPSRAAVQKVKLVESVRAAQEDALISQGVKELQLLVDIVVGELSSELSALKHRRSTASGLGFLGSRKAAGVLDVRFLPPESPFPTIAGLVQAMENRRTASEDAIRQRIAELELKLLQALNAMVAKALRHHLASGV